jgi:hypothetical protein
MDRSRSDIHLGWITKYRYKVLRGEVVERARELLRQICAAREVLAEEDPHARELGGDRAQTNTIPDTIPTRRRRHRIREEPDVLSPRKPATDPAKVGIGRIHRGGPPLG